MNTLDAEATFFKEIAPKVRALVTGYHGKAAISVQKTTIDYATEVDIAVEDLIVAEIQLRFPGDLILAEEGHNDTAIPDGRIWIIDPICGTTNLGRALTAFCTNIALAENHELIASCVVDHSQDDFFWSVGSGLVYVNDVLFKKNEKNTDLGFVIDVDMGAVTKETRDADKLTTYTSFLHNVLTKPNYMPMSLNSSLGFAYTAIGKLDGFLNSDNHPWDICAAAFLIQQTGGVITDVHGNPWKIGSFGAIGALDSAVHAEILKAYLNT